MANDLQLRASASGDRQRPRALASLCKAADATAGRFKATRERLKQLNAQQSDVAPSAPGGALEQSAPALAGQQARVKAWPSRWRRRQPHPPRHPRTTGAIVKPVS